MKNKMKKLIGINITKAPIEVKWKELDRASDESMYRSVCPVCIQGILLIRRNWQTGKLEKEDRCILCGQAVIYIDLDETGLI